MGAADHAPRATRARRSSEKAAVLRSRIASQPFLYGVNKEKVRTNNFWKTIYYVHVLKFIMWCANPRHEIDTNQSLTIGPNKKK